MPLQTHDTDQTHVAQSPKAPELKSAQESALAKVESETAHAAVELDVPGRSSDVPKEIREKARTWLESYMAFLMSRVEWHNTEMAKWNERQRRDRPVAQLGEPTVGQYVYWDLLTISPIQFIGAPPFRPHKIIAAGEWAMLASILYINPAPANGHPSATTVLGGRTLRIRFEQMDITNVLNGPDFTFAGQLPPIAPVLTAFFVLFQAPDPGVNPRILDLTVTADITNFGQPFAAFQTNHFDIDADPGFLLVPPQPPQFRNQTPLRYMIYRLS